MAEAFKRLAQGRFAGSTAKIYDVPSSTEAIIKTMNISNNTGTDRIVTLHHVDNGGSTADTNLILPGVNIVAGGFAEWEGTMTMAALTESHGVAAAANEISYTIWGIEIS